MNILIYMHNNIERQNTNVKKKKHRCFYNGEYLVRQYNKQLVEQLLSLKFTISN